MYAAILIRLKTYRMTLGNLSRRKFRIDVDESRLFSASQSGIVLNTLEGWLRQRFHPTALFVSTVILCGRTVRSDRSDLRPQDSVGDRTANLALNTDDAEPKESSLMKASNRAYSRTYCAKLSPLVTAYQICVYVRMMEWPEHPRTMSMSHIASSEL